MTYTQHIPREETDQMLSRVLVRRGDEVAFITRFVIVARLISLALSTHESRCLVRSNCKCYCVVHGRGKLCRTVSPLRHLLFSSLVNVRALPSYYPPR